MQKPEEIRRGRNETKKQVIEKESKIQKKPQVWPSYPKTAQIPIYSQDPSLRLSWLSQATGETRRQAAQGIPGDREQGKCQLSARPAKFRVHLCVYLSLLLSLSRCPSGRHQCPVLMCLSCRSLMRDGLHAPFPINADVRCPSLLLFSGFLFLSPPCFPSRDIQLLVVLCVFPPSFSLVVFLSPFPLPPREDAAKIARLRCSPHVRPGSCFDREGERGGRSKAENMMVSLSLPVSLEKFLLLASPQIHPVSTAVFVPRLPRLPRLPSFPLPCPPSQRLAVPCLPWSFGARWGKGLNRSTTPNFAIFSREVRE